VITHPEFAVEPWSVTETGLNVDVLAQSESVFSLSNGHIGLRGNLDEGEPFGLPGTYLNAFYETRPLPYAEAGYGYPEDGQTVVNVTNGKIIRLLVDDEPFDLRYGELLEHRRSLDLRAGVLRRSTHWRSPGGREVEVTSVRLVSFVQRSVAAIRYTVRACDGAPLRVAVQSVLVANEPGSMKSADPRAAAILAAPLVAEDHALHDVRATLVHRTRQSDLRMAAAMEHVVDGPDDMTAAADINDDLARAIFSAELPDDGTLTVTKFLAYGWSSQRSLPSIRDQVDGALLAAKSTGWDGLVARQREYLDDFWERADVEIEGDEELQQAVRFALFHTLQAGARAEQRALPAKGLTGPGYDGHAFWDTESFVLPVLTYTAPEAAADALRWRWSTLEEARQRAEQLHLQGAAFPWRTIRGQECSAYWPAGTAAFHVNADIADAALRYIRATGDEAFARREGLELLVETARLWRSLGHHDSEGVFHIDGVTGPDEYSAIVDDNVYTNLMAERNLRNAADLAARYTDEAAALSVDDEELAAWRDAANAMHVPYDERLGVHPQDADFLHHRVPNFSAWDEDAYPLLLHVPYFRLYAAQVVKQPDLVLALLTRGDRFTSEQKARNFAYYEAITVRDSSLSACVQAVVAAEVGHLELAYDYFGEAALMDLDDLEHNTRDGLHMASLAGSWVAAVAGFGGTRDSRRGLTFRPRLPAALSRLRFRLLHRGRRLCVDVRHGAVTFELVAGEPMDVFHYDERIALAVGEPVTREWSPPDPGPEPTQPPGRAPARRRRRT
jgi:alpha,alpha-trehalose phosphorylase